MITEIGYTVVDHLIYPDHSMISHQEIVKYTKRIQANYPNAILVGTEKDWSRLTKWPSLDLPLFFSRLEMKILSDQTVWDLLISSILSCKKKKKQIE